MAPQTHTLNERMYRALYKAISPNYEVDSEGYLAGVQAIRDLLESEGCAVRDDVLREAADAVITVFADRLGGIHGPTRALLQADVLDAIRNLGSPPNA